MVDNWRTTVKAILNEIFEHRFEIRDYSTRDFGREPYPDAVSVVLPQREAFDHLHVVRDVIPDGLVAFVGTTQWLGREKHDGAELVVGRGESQFDILILAASNAVNYNMDTGDLIKRLEVYDQQYGIDIFHAETDTIEFVLHNIPADLAAFVADLNDFCPDTEEEDALADYIQSYGTVFLWWD